MRDTFYLAWRYVSFHRLSTVWLVACISLTLFLPLVSRILVSRFQNEIEQRAEATPFLIGANGSRFELAIHSLHFTGTPSTTLPYGELSKLFDSDLGVFIPIHAKFRTREFDAQPEGYPIVGTSLDYFSFRDLKLAKGREFGRIGDCVLGSEVARKHRLGPGDTLMSQAGNAFNLVGGQPVMMRIVGVLKPNHSDDDQSVFVDTSTAWIIEGLGHGHDDLREVDEAELLGQDGDTYVASAAVTQYIEINDDNVDTFHFHGDPETFPITAIIAEPHDEKAGLILEGRFVEDDSELMIIRPVDVMDELTERVFRARKFFDAIVAIVGLITLLFVALVTLLSRKLRAQEMATMFKIGCGKATMLRLQVTELAIVFGISVVCALGLSLVTLQFSGELIREIVF